MLGLVGAFALGVACAAFVLRRREIGLPVIVGVAATGVVCLAVAASSTPAPPVGLVGTTETAITGATVPTTQATTTDTPVTSTTEATTADDGLARVVTVIDGDTVDVVVDGVAERVRLIGINTPERGECFADIATDVLTDLVGGGQVALTSDSTARAQYGRLLRYIHLPDGRFVNEMLVAQGLARAVSYPPDTTHDHVFATAQTDAQRARIGLWAPDACGSPTNTDVGFSAAVFDPPGDDLNPITGERVTVTNRADVPIELTDWIIADEGPHRFSFPDGFVLDAGASVTVYTACGVETVGFLYWCNQGSAVWNNSGDTAFLWDPLGNIIDSTGPMGTPPTND